MGQYYMPVNIDNYQYIYPHDFGSGAKLMEHSWLLNPFVGTVMSLIHPSGSWGPCRLVWAGDYMDGGLYIPDNDGPVSISTRQKDYTLHSYCGEKGVKAARPPIKDGLSFGYILNHDKKLYVDLKDLPDVDGWIVHPLPLLTCSGNGRGGGDYRSEEDIDNVGSWAGDTVSSAYGFENVEGFEKLIVKFKED